MMAGLGRGRGWRGWLAIDGAESLHQSIMIDFAGRCNDQGAGAVVPAPVLHDLASAQSRDRARATRSPNDRVPTYRRSLRLPASAANSVGSSACMEISSKITARSASTSSP